MADLTHLFRAQVFFREQIKVIAGSAILLWFGVLLLWELDSPGADRLLLVTAEQMQGWWGLGAIIGVALTLLMGYRAHQAALSQPIGAAFSVAWRIGVIWGLLFAFAEAGLVGNAVRTVTTFPIFLFSSTIFLAGGFMLGYLANAIWSRAKEASWREWLTAVAYAVGTILAALGLVFDILDLIK